MASQNPRNRTLRSLRTKLKEIKVISDTDGTLLPYEFQVIGIYCYIADANFLKGLTPEIKNDDPVKLTNHLYDIVITDGVEKLKCLLAFPLGPYVQKNLLKVGSFIKLEQVKMCFVESEFNGGCLMEYVLIENFAIRQYATVTFPALDTLTFVPSENHREQNMLPLETGRKYYLNTWVTNMPYGEIWLNDNLPLFRGDGIQMLQNILDFASEYKKMGRVYPPILVRVLARGHLVHFGHTRENNEYPFNGHFEFGDSTAIIRAKVCQEASKNFYYSLKPGMNLVIDNYYVTNRVIITDRPRLRGAAGNLPNVSIGLSMYKARIQVVPEYSAEYRQEVSRLPPLEFSFCNRASLQYAAEESTVDIVGLVTHVGRSDRFKINSGCCRVRCWLELVDSSSHLPIRILLYHAGQRFPHDEILPLQILVATHMKVCHRNYDSRGNELSDIFLKNTFYSEVYIKHSENSPYIRNPAFVSVVNLKQDNNKIDYLLQNVIRFGGVTLFPPLPKGRDAFIEFFKMMIPGPRWKETLDNLVYRQRERMVVGGSIIQVDFVDLQTVDSPYPVYGWSYALNVRSRRTLYYNIKAKQKLHGRLPLNLKQNGHLLFPCRFTVGNVEALKIYRQFPPLNAVHWAPNVQEEVESIPVLADGYYVISLASLHYEALLQVVYIPEPTCAPHPSFLDSLSGNKEVLMPQANNMAISEPPRYTLAEVKEIAKTVHEAANKALIFVLQVSREETDTIQAIAHRAFLCPQEAVRDAMTVDRTLP